MEKVLKIVLKIAIVILIIMMIAIGWVYVKNLIIFGTIRLKGREILKSDNYHITITSTMPEYDYLVKKEVYTKDDLQTIYIYNHEDLNEIHWKDYSSEESVAHVLSIKGSYETEYDTNLMEEIETLIKLKNFSLLKNCVSNVVETKDGYYVFSAGRNYELYFNQFTGELVKSVIYNEDLETVNMINEYKFELDKVIDENVKKPIMEE